MLKSLVYVSSASGVMSKTELLKILEKSAINNSRLEITGMLLYYDGTFIQVLEGEADNVDLIMKQVSNDTRHKDITIVLEENIKSREFGNWEMGFRFLEDDEMNKLPGSVNVNELYSYSGNAKQMLKTFYEMNIKSQIKYYF